MGMMLLPPGEGVCPVCAVVHDGNLPHDASSLYYQYRFHALRGRWPHWVDAMAHCSEEVRRLWTLQLRALGQWTDPVNEPIADPPAESIRQVVGYGDASDERG